MSETEKPFTVSDRRHFTPDGRVRDEAEAPAEPVEAPADSEAPRTEEKAASPEPEAQPEAGPTPPPEGGQEPGGPAGPVDFTQFLLSLGAQASMLLTGQGLPEGAEADPQAALDAARSYISILEMLQEKTRGNRTDDEERVLEGLLYELRMAYVEMSRAGGS